MALKRVLVAPGPSSTNLPLEGHYAYIALTREFQTLASLRHPHIISVLDYGFDQQRQPYFTMDLLAASQTIMDAGRDQPLAIKIKLLVQLLQALAYLHRRGILHRDLKPANVLITNGEVKVLDFGLAAAREQAAITEGTPAYLAPEVLLGKPATEASDLYAVGVIAYELLVGRHPFNTSNLSGLINDVLKTQPDITPLDSVADTPLSGPSEVPPTIPLPPAAVPAVTDIADQPVDEKTRILNLPDGNTSIPVPPTRQPSTRLGSIIDKLLRKDPVLRYIDANVVIRELSLAIGEPLPIETVATRESFLQAAQFIGREMEMSQLLTALNHTLSNYGAVWMIGGESGVGKSRLLDELRTSALVKGILVVRGEASDNGLPFQVWREPLRRLVLNVDLTDADAAVLKAVVPDIELLVGRSLQDVAELESDQMQKRLISVITSLIYRQKQPLLIILEDLQWALSESLTLLRQLIPLVADCSILIAASYRDDENFRVGELLPDAHSLKLNRLTGNEVAKLAEAMLGESGRRPQVYSFLQQETEGNVFFLVEVARALAENAGALSNIGEMTLPTHIFTGGVQRMVERRLNRVNPVHYPLLQIAAVFGRQLNVAVLKAVAQAEEINTWLLECSEATVLEVHDEHWRFAHDKLRESILSGIAADARPALHRRVAQAIEAVYPDPRDYAANLAYHWRIGGDMDKEAHYEMVAAQQAYRISAYEEAVAHFRRALALTGDNDALVERRTRLMTDLARVYVRLNNYSEASQLLEQSLVLALKNKAPELQAEALWSSGIVALIQGDYATAKRLLTDSETLFRTAGNMYGTADTLRGLARVNIDQGAYEEALKQLEESLTLSRQLNDEWRIADALINLGNVAGVQGAFTDATNNLEAALALFKKLGDRDGMAQTLLTLGQIALFESQYPQATDYLTNSLSISREIGDQRTAADVLNNLGYSAFVQKNFAEAKPFFEECVAIYERVGFQWGIANTLINLGHVASGSGNSNEAKDNYRRALQLAISLGAVPLQLEIIAGMARIEAHAQNPAKAVELAGVALYHQASSPDIGAIVEPLLSDLQQALGTQALEQILEESKKYELSKVSGDLFQT